MDYLARARRAAQEWADHAKTPDTSGGLSSFTSFNSSSGEEQASARDSLSSFSSFTSSPRKANAAAQREGYQIRAEGNTKETKNTKKERTSNDLQPLKNRLPSSSYEISLDPQTVREVLGPAATNSAAVGAIRAELAAALREIKHGIVTAQLPRRHLVRGRPLCDWLTIDQIAGLLGAWDCARRGRS
jgi:hypothetical protein